MSSRASALSSLAATLATSLLLAVPATSIALVPALDADLDTMDDNWELANGLNPNDPADALEDADGDLVTNRGEYHLGSDPQDGNSLPPFTDNLTESFETGSIPSAWFVPGTADGGWFAENVAAADGSWSLRSERVSQYDQAEIILPVYVHHSEFTIEHYWNAFEAEPFRIFIDGERVHQVGTTPRGWVTSPTFILEEGYHEIRFFFWNANVSSRGCNCTRIDDLRIVLRDVDLDGLPDDWEVTNGFNPADPGDALLDGDSDGLDTLGEYRAGTDFSNPDSDGDGVNDGDEVNLYSSDPLNTDTDDDGMPDDYEVAQGFDPTDAADGDSDADGDGVTNTGEYRLGSDPRDANSTPAYNDNFATSFEDGMLPFGWYTAEGADGGFYPENVTARDGAWSLRSENVPPHGRAIVEFPILVHLSDFRFSLFLNSANSFDFPGYDEVEVRIDGEVVYSRSDLPRGWTDSPAIEVEPGYHVVQFVFYEDSGAGACRCVRIDSVSFTQVDADGDGMRDEWETWYGLNPADPGDGALDLDGDGLTNLEEYRNNTRPQRVDSDFDSLSDYAEVVTYGTDPNSRDTDGDQINDDYEVNSGLDPLDAADANLDNDSDSYSNVVEYRLETDPADAGSVPALQKSFTENFENSLPLAWYNPDGPTASWYLSTDDASEGNASFRNQPHPAGGSTSDQKRVRFVFNTVEGRLYFDYRNIEAVYEWPGTGSGHTGWLRTYLDGSTSSSLNATSNTDEWQTYSIQVEEGLHELEFLHSSIHPQNFAYIDNVRFIATDADEDKLEDEWELRYGLDPNDPADAAQDLDGDGLSNQEERWTGSNPTRADTDNDGLSDADEIRYYGTRTFDYDQDNDRMSDGYEVANGLDPNDNSDKTLDSDNDGVQNFAEALLGTSASDPASTPAFNDNAVISFEGGAIPADWFVPAGSDSDWYPDPNYASDGGWSLRSGPVSYNNPISRDTRITLPLVAHESDFQFDFFWNGSGNDTFSVYIDDVRVMFVNNASRRWQSSPVFRLTEGYHEVRFEYAKINSGSRGCNCTRIDNIRLTLRDTDTDRMPDEYELANGLNPNDAADAALDPDGDGLSSFDEWQRGTLAGTADTDGDGVNDGDEINLHGSDPLRTDSDSDELDDGWEVLNGLNPTDFADAYSDPDGDGVFTLGEVRLGRDPFSPEALPAYQDSYSESFEGGVLPSGWLTPATSDAPWAPDSATARDGSYNLRSGSIDSDEISAVVLPLTTHLADLQLWHYWNAGTSDVFRIFINGELAYSAVNVARGWLQTPPLELQAGYNEVRFEHAETEGAACQCTRIDSLTVTRVDADGDGMRDSWELANGLNPADPADGALDSDADGLDNAGEYRAGSSLTLADTDGDGINDADEVLIHRTDAAAADTDGDYMPDLYELNHGLDPRIASGTEDADDDGYRNIEEYRLGSLPDDSLSTPPFLGDFVESFEGSLSPTAWYQPDPSRGIEWDIDSTTSTDGSHSLGTTPRGVSSQTETRVIEWMFNIRGSTYVLDHNALYSFSGLANRGESLRIELDGQLIEYRGGEVGWFDTDYPYFDFDKRTMTPGVHVLRFEFESLGSADGSERAWIDNLRFDELGSP